MFRMLGTRRKTHPTGVRQVVPGLRRVQQRQADLGEEVDDFWVKTARLRSALWVRTPSRPTDFEDEATAYLTQYAVVSSTQVRVVEFERFS